MATGKQLFDDRVEHPLPVSPDVGDYVFHFVPKSDGYGEGARAFLDRFYPGHHKSSPSNLQKMVETIAADIDGGGVTRVREIVVVAHGSPVGLQVPLVPGTSETTLAEYRALSAFSLACLRADLIAGTFADFAQARARLVAHLDDTSWVTVRACRVGMSLDCMYALYSFFGGRANVYAPRQYQLFGSQPLTPGMRVETRLEAHEHLVKQRLLPLDRHTPERKDAVVRALLDPAGFIEPFALLTTRLEAPSAEYVQAVESLDRRRLTPALTQAFADHEHPLSTDARVVRIPAPGATWVVGDELEHQGTHHRVEYDLFEKVELEGGRIGGDGTLMASARLPGAFTVLDTTVPDRSPEYVRCVAALDDKRLDPLVSQSFSDHGHELSRRARVVGVIRRGEHWVVGGFQRRGDGHERVEYDIRQLVQVGDDGEGSAGLDASVRVAEWFGLQLFFDQEDQDEWRRRLLVLAAYAEPPPEPPLGDADAQTGEDPARKQRFDAVVAALEAGRLVDGAVDIPELFRTRADIELDAAAAVARVSRSGTGRSRRITWAIQDQQRYLVELEHPPTADGETGHTLTVYLSLEGAERLASELDVMSSQGSDPDTPGTELPAYLDRLSAAELMLLMDHLRAPYRPEHSYYIHHAQQAIKRKSDFHAWWQEQYGEIGLADPLPEYPYAELRGIESDDKNRLVHHFDFNGVWQEVKASNPSPTAFQSDLFVEEDLWRRLRHRAEDLDDRSLAPEIEADSPAVSLEETRQLLREGLGPFPSMDKSLYEPDEQDEESCEELAAALARWQELDGEPSDEIERILGEEKAASGRSLLSYVEWLYDKYKIAKIGLDLYGISTAKTGLAVRLLEKIPAFAPTAYGVPTTAGALLRAAPAITIPLTMWLKVLEAQSEALAAERRRGRLTAIRQWLRALRRWTGSADFPDDLTISMDPSQAIDRYFDERVIEFNDHFQWIYDGEQLEAGFAEGLTIMEQAGPDLVAHADEAVAAVMREFELTGCEMRVLRDAGLVDPDAIKAEVLRALVAALLKRIPRV